MIKNEVGKIYGRLVVVERSPSVGGKAMWLCRCSCGNTKTVSGDSLRQGKVRSCGCFQQESRTKARTHGMSRSPTYRSWQEMRVRCNDKFAISYANYGGRGVRVCKRWDRFENFLADMGVRPKGAFLERKNNNRNYTPKNCVWATRLQQNRNKRSNVTVEYKGRKTCLSAWCEELDLPYPRMYYRIVVKGWVARTAFETPFLTHKERIKRNASEGT